MSDHDVDPEADELDELLETAWRELDEGRGAAARTLAREAAERAPELPEPWLLLAECARADGDAAAALRDAERALDLAEEDDEFVAAVVLKAGLLAEAGRDRQAREALAELPPADVVLPDPLLALDVADLWLGLDDPAQARARYQAVADAHPELADAWYGLGLAAEDLDDEAGKRAAWLRALERDEADDAASTDDAACSSEGPRLTEAAFAEVAEAAMGELPARACELLANVPVVVAERPSRADVETGLDPRLLGLFVGTPYPEQSNLGGAPALTQILLFQRNLERAAADEPELRAEIRTTLLHETGHFFGLDEDDLEAVGLD